MAILLWGAGMKLKSVFLKVFTIGLLISVFLRILVGIRQASSNQPISLVEKSRVVNDYQAPIATKTKQNLLYSQGISHKLIGSSIITQFAPTNSQGEPIKLSKLASASGFDHFNWVSYVEKDPYGIANKAGQQLSAPYSDPPLDGYQYDAADKFPFYWDLVKCDRCQQRHHFENPKNLEQFRLIFYDVPADYRLQPGEAVEFTTNLVGVKSYDIQLNQAEWEVLYTFRWKLTNSSPYHSQVSLIETDVDLAKLTPLLLDKMRLEGAVL